jgi:hypothetical protein
MVGGFVNRRAELYHWLLEALQSEEGLKLPDDDLLHADLTCLSSRHDSSGRLLIESKDIIRRKLGRSPDLGDAVALTFADGLHAARNTARLKITPGSGVRHSGPFAWMS